MQCEAGGRVSSPPPKAGLGPIRTKGIHGLLSSANLSGKGHGLNTIGSYNKGMTYVNDHAIAC